MADWFLAWVDRHCLATAADASAAGAIIANRAIIEGEPWFATAAELADCTRRLVATNRTPKFGNEHVDAVGRELIALRSDARDIQRAAPPTACASCGGTGWASVPHPECVYERRLVCYPGSRAVYTSAVLCDCTAGQAATELEDRRYQQAEAKERVRRPHSGNLHDYHARFQVDGPALLREYARAQAVKARNQTEPGTTLGELFPNLARKLAGIGQPQE